jgi:hypothetical protein
MDLMSVIAMERKLVQKSITKKMDFAIPCHSSLKKRIII